MWQGRKTKGIRKRTKERRARQCTTEKRESREEKESRKEGKWEVLMNRLKKRNGE